MTAIVVGGVSGAAVIKALEADVEITTRLGRTGQTDQARVCLAGPKAAMLSIRWE